MRGQDVDASASVSRGRLVSREPWRSFFDDYALAVTLGLSAGIVGLSADGDGEPGRARGLFVLASFCLGVYLAWKSYRSYRLQVVRVDDSREQVVAKVLEGFRALGWNVVHQDDRIISARTRISPLTWGQEITIIFEIGRLHFNSRNAAKRLVLPLSFGRNGWNYRQFRACVERASAPREGSLFSPAIGPSEAEYVRAPEHVGCALGLLPVIAFLVFLIVQGLKDATLPVRAPSYPGEIVPSLGLGGVSVIAAFLSFFLAVFAKFAFGLVAGRAVSILSLPLTLVFFALYSLAVLSTGIFPDQVRTLLLMAAIAGGSAVLLGSSRLRGFQR